MADSREHSVPAPWTPPAPWRYAPEHEVGVVLPIERVLSGGPEMRIALLGVVAYRSGFKLRLGALRAYPGRVVAVAMRQAMMPASVRCGRK
jgi:hypothetical protein